MKEVRKLLQIREKELEKLKKEKELAMQNVPEGTLRVCDNANRTQYYHRVDPKDTRGTYISTKNHDLICRLAQKEYDQKILRAIDKELSITKKYLSGYPTVTAEQIYDTMHKKKQVLIQPIQESDEVFIKKWINYDYQGKGVDLETPEYYTAKKERVRSKSELIIADLLNRESVPYRYECPIYIKGIGQIYPDFTVLNTKKRREYFWEHFGMMDDPSYAEKALKKLSTYEQNGIFPGEQLIVTFETRKNPLSQKQVLNFIEHYLKY